MKKILALMAMLAGAAFGQTATVLITDTIFDIQGNKPNCTVYVGNPAFVDNSGFTRVANTVQTVVNSGALSINLVPTANAQTLGVVYTVTYGCQNGPPQGSTKEFWNVPAGPGPFVLSQVRVAPIVTTGGVASINGDATHVQTITRTNDPNVTLTITDNGTGNHLLALGWQSTLSATRGGSGEAGTITGPLKGNGTSPFTAAVAADITGLYTGCTGVLLLGADGACHSGGGGGGLPNVYANTTYIWSQSPAGTLTGTTPATVTLTPCPGGLNGTDTNHWLRVAGTGTAETVIITGGSCTSGAGSGSVQFTPANSHSAGWTLATSTNGAEEAYQAGKAAGIPFEVAIIGNATFTGPMIVDVSNVTIAGSGFAHVFCNMDASTSFNCIQLIGIQANFHQTTTTTNLALNQRSLVTSNTIGVVSATGFVAGMMTELVYDDGTFHFEQYNPIQAVSGLNVTFVDPIVVPLLTTFVGNVAAFTGFAANEIVRDIEFDCTGTSASVTGVTGLYAFQVQDSTFDNLGFNNCNESSNGGGFLAYIGYNNSFRRIRARNSGSLGQYGVGLNRQSEATGNDLVSEGNGLNPPGAFGLGFNYVYNSTFSNLIASGNAERQIKLLGSGWNVWSNLVANNSFLANGLAVTIGSYRNQFMNVMAMFNPSGAGAGQGVWLSGQDNEYNKFWGVTALQNGQDIAIGATDINNTFLATTFTTGPFQASGAQTDSPGGNRVDPMAGQISIANLSCNGTAPPSTTILPAQAGATAWACSTATAPTVAAVSIQATGPGYIRNLRVTAGTGGVNGSSGVVTVNKQGSGTTGVTCTLGTGTSCSDMTHWFPTVAGDIYNITITTQGAETLANPLVSFEY